MDIALSKQDKISLITSRVQIVVILISSFLFAFADLFAEESRVTLENSFSTYLSERLKEKRFEKMLYRKIWNYLSNPSSGYQKVGITPEELSSIVRDYIDENYLNFVVSTVMDVASIDTSETDASNDKSENIKIYLQHIQSLANRYRLQVTNIQNQFLVITMDGDPPPLGLVGKIRVSSNFINYVRPQIKENVIYATGINSSKTAVDLVLISMGIIKAINLKPANRIHLFVDLSLMKMGNNVDILYNSFELAPINLVLDSYFPFVNAEYGFATLRLVQNIENSYLSTPIKKIVYNGSEYKTPDTAILCFKKEKADRELVEKEISAFRKKYNNINVELIEDDSLCVKFVSEVSSKGASRNILDFLVLFLVENRDLYDSRIRLFEFLKRNVVLNSSGKGFGINRNHPILKSTEVILKGVGIGKDDCSADIYVRFPFGIDSKQIVERVNHSVETFNRKENTSLEVYVNAYNPIIIDPNSQLIKILKKAYQEVTFRPPKPLIADGLYTKLFPNPVGFGPHFQNEGTQGEGHISQQELLKILKIYTTALIYLIARPSYE